MNVQSYPLSISVYKGEGRILMIPYIKHKLGGYSVNAEWFVSMPDTEESSNVGRAVLSAVEFIKSSPPSVLTPKEREMNAAWKKNTKYKSRVSFWKNNHHALINIWEDGQYNIYSQQRSEKRRDMYSDIIQKITLPANVGTEEIGQAVLDVLEASEAYYRDHKETDGWRKKTLELSDGSGMTVTCPKDRHFEDCDDCGAAEIYQCYEYHTQEGSESSAEFFFGMAPELNCSLKETEVHTSWEDVYGKTEFFEMKEADHGIFRLRAEMRNKGCHKISYFLQMSEDLLLECGMEVHQPGRRKKLDEKLAGLFEEFAMGCSF